MPNTITIIIPVKNREKIVQRTLESVSRQTAPAFDVILVDNGSDDGSLKVLRDWQIANNSATRNITVLTEPIAGAPAARNTGLAAVVTPWTLFFDSDDIMLENHIRRILEGIKRYPDADVIGWNVRHICSGIKKFYTKDICWYNLFEGGFATLRWCARTDLIRKAGSWNNNIRLWDDIELGARILALKPKLYHLGKEITVEVYPQEHSISTNKNGDYLERIEIPLISIAATLPEHARIWTDYIRMTEAGNTYRMAGDNAEIRHKAERLVEDVTHRAPSTAHRLLLKALFHFRRLGGRGQNMILKPLLS